MKSQLEKECRWCSAIFLTYSDQKLFCNKKCCKKYWWKHTNEKRKKPKPFCQGGCGKLVMRGHCSSCWRKTERGKKRGRETMKIYRQKHPEMMKQSNRRWKTKSKLWIENYRLTKCYGITLEQRKEMELQQDGKCAICNQQRKLGVDHNHLTNQTRELLCRPCNAMIGLAKENLAVLQSAMDYLNKHAK